MANLPENVTIKITVVPQLELPMVRVVGLHAAKQINHMRLFTWSRYRLESVPGRPEEMAQPGTGRRVSFAYGCRTVRVRWQQERTWLGHVDFQIVPDWMDSGQVAELRDLLDRHFHFVTPALLAPAK